MCNPDPEGEKLSVYLKLLHGRNDPDQDMNGWGFDGPLLGPFATIHFTYKEHIRCVTADGHEALELGYHEDLLAYDGRFYGDFEVAADFDMTTTYHDAGVQLRLPLTAGGANVLTTQAQEPAIG